MALAQPLKWHGGKYYLAKRIIALMPPHLHYVEPYFGGGAVLLARDPARDWYAGAADLDRDPPPSYFRGCSEAVNDLNGELANFWQVIQDQAACQELQRRCLMTPFSQSEFQRALQFDSSITPPDVDAAHAFFVRYRQSRQGLGKDFATLSRNRTRRRMNEQAASWLTAVDGLPDIHARLQGVVIFSEDALRVIRREDNSRTLFYLDPPYLHETRITTRDYTHEMSVEDHQTLLETLAGLQGKFLLSGYRSSLYDDFAERQQWRRVDIEIDNKASNKRVKDKEVECLWMNYACGASARPAGP